MADEQKRTYPPYLAFTSFKNFIAGLRSSGLPGRIDKSIMGSLSGATQSSLILTLKYLKLVSEEGAPLPPLSSLVEGPEQNAAAIYTQVIAKCYGFVGEKGVSLETATQRQLEEAFEAQGISGETLRKAVSFFVLLATEAGMKVSTHLKSAKRKTSGSPRKARKREAGEQGHGAGSPPPAPPTHVDAPGHKTYTLDLSEDGSRILKITAPTDIKAEEIDRLSGWMHFQYNVAWKKVQKSSGE